MFIKSLWRLVPTYFMILNLKNREEIIEEINIWLKCKGKYNNEQSNIRKMEILMQNNRDAYRNLLLIRVIENKSFFSKLAYKYIRIVYPALNTLYINTKLIGKNFLINHGFSTIITAKSIGDDCMISQQVTIGVKKPRGGLPTIGNNVSIYSGAKILGDITIGDNVIIGANAVVITDIPSNTVVGGFLQKS